MNKRLVSIIVLCALSACLIWIVPTKTQKIASLNTEANDVSADPEVRCRAICRLFEDFVKPGCTIAQLRSVLTDVRWLERTNLQGVSVIGGAIPVDFQHGPVFYILLPTANPPTGDVVYFTLSENGPNSEDECLAIMKSKSDQDANVRLVEFALCYPDGCDTFTQNGKKSKRPKAWDRAWYWLKYRLLQKRGQ